MRDEKGKQKRRERRGESKTDRQTEWYVVGGNRGDRSSSAAAEVRMFGAFSLYWRGKSLT